MAQNSDGSVHIDVSLSASEAEKELAHLKKQILKTAEDVSKQQYKKSQLEEQLAAAEERYKELYQTVHSQDFSKLPAGKQEETYSLIGAAEVNAEKLREQIEKYDGKIQDTNTELDAQCALYQRLSEMAGLLSQEEQERTDADGLEGGGAEQAEEAVFSWREMVARAVAGIPRLFQTVFSKAASAVSTATAALSRLARTAAGVFVTAARYAKAFGSRILDTAKKLNVFKRTADAIGPTLKRTLGLVKRVFVFSMITKGLRVVRESLGNYLAVNQELQTSLGQLKSVMLTAFQPIYEAAVPALNSLIQSMTRVTAAIAEFIAALFGTTAKQAQENAKALNEEAEALDNTGSAAKSAKGSLASFDKINTINTEDKDAGKPLFDYDFDDTMYKSWGEAFDAFLDRILNEGIPKLRKDLLDFADWLNDFSDRLYEMFTFPGVADKVVLIGDQFADAFNQMVARINWRRLGEAFGAGLNLALLFLTSAIYGFDWIALGRGIADFINGAVSQINWYAMGQLLWAGFKIGIETLAGLILGLDMPLLGRAATQLALGFFNSIIETIQSISWDQIGLQIATFLNSIDWIAVLTTAAEAIGLGINALFQMMYTFFANLEWAEIGRAVGVGFNRAVTTIDWALLGKTASAGIIGILDFISKAVETADWGEVAKKIEELLLAVDWSGLASAVCEAFGAAFGAAAAILWQWIKDAWDSVVNWWHEAAFEDGRFTITGLLEGIWSGIKGIAGWIKEHIFQPFIDGFRKAFGIASPAKATQELGRFLVDGLKKGVTDSVASVIATFTGLREKIKEVFSHISDWFKNTFTRAWDSVKAVFSRGGRVFDGIKDGILSSLKAIINALIDGINRVIAIPFRGLNDALNRIKGIDILGAHPFSLLPSIDVPQIPRLAQGAVIPPNREFLAVLGDQSHGRNLEAPEDLLRQISQEGNAQIIALLQQLISVVREGKNVYLDGQKISDNTVRHINGSIARTGTIPLNI